MKICPRCNFPSQSNTECDKCGVQFADIKKNRGDVADRQCRYYDSHGRCNGSADYSDQPVGGGKYCRTHWYQVMNLGTPAPFDAPAGDTWRQRWYRERDLPYQPAKLVDCPPFRCVGTVADMSKYGPRQRQPGEDSREDIGE